MANHADELPGRDLLFRLADAADRETLPRFRQNGAVNNKLAAGFDPVTQADREAERAIRAVIESEHPDHAILGEEHGASGEGRLQWVIDPIDGTRAFISGIPVWGTLIGFYVDGRARAGIMSQPFTGERFWADGSGSFRTDRFAGEAPNRTRGTATLAEAIAFTTSPRLFTGKRLAGFGRLEAGARLTRFGTDCYAFAMLAAGQIDLVVEAGLQPYDIAALIPIVEQAGGVVTTLDGAPAEAGGDVLASANAALHREALALFGSDTG